MVTEKMKWEVWNHFIARWAVDKQGGGAYVTGFKLRKIRDRIWNDYEFWWDIIIRHKITMSLEVIRKRDPENYRHIMGNFWGMLIQTGVGMGMNM